MVVGFPTLHHPAHLSTPTTPLHLPRLDVLRGIAILMVLGLHSYGSIFGWNDLNWSDIFTGTVDFPGWTRILCYPLTLGRDGVALFFVLSGYVIHLSFLKNANFTWLNYMSRRFWRIYPPYLVILIALALWQHRLRTSDFILHTALLHNLSYRHFFSFNGSFWSIAIEAQLYCLYPLAIFFKNKGGRNLMMIIGIVSSLAWIVKLFLMKDYYGIPANPIVLWPSWLLGAYLADLHHTGGRLFNKPMLPLTIGIGLWLGTLCSIFTIHFLAAALLSTIVLETYIFNSRPMGKPARLIAWIGTISYSLYLIHQPFMSLYAEFISSKIHRPGIVLLCFIPYCIACIGLSWLLYVTLERGSQKFGKYLSR